MKKYSKLGRTGQQAPVFFRPPMVIHVQVPELECMPVFLLIGIHVRPYRAYGELNGLVSTYDRSKKKYGTENALILGDLNADCNFFGTVDKAQTVLRNRGDFKWLVDDKTVTNIVSVGKEGCAYDRSVGT